MRAVWLVVLALPLMAAAPRGQAFTLTVPSDPGLPFPAPQSKTAPNYAPAPLPNRDVSTPAPGRASTEPTLAPTLFTSRTQFRGDGFSPGSTAQSDQERRTKPGAGFSLHMPITPQ